MGRPTAARVRQCGVMLGRGVRCSGTGTFGGSQHGQALACESLEGRKTLAYIAVQFVLGAAINVTWLENKAAAGIGSRYSIAEIRMLAGSALKV